MNYIKQDITTVTSPAVIIHGVNCQRRMQTGVAKSLYSKWPAVKESYMAIAKDEMTLGSISAVKIDDALHVVNYWTQGQYGYDGKNYASVEAIETGLRNALQFCEEIGIDKLYAPKIGGGLGGLDWQQEVEPIFQTIQTEYPHINITICEID